METIKNMIQILFMMIMFIIIFIAISALILWVVSVPFLFIYKAIEITIN